MANFIQVIIEVIGKVNPDTTKTWHRFGHFVALPQEGHRVYLSKMGVNGNAAHVAWVDGVPVVRVSQYDREFLKEKSMEEHGWYPGRYIDNLTLQNNHRLW